MTTSIVTIPFVVRGEQFILEIRRPEVTPEVPPGAPPEPGPDPLPPDPPTLPDAPDNEPPPPMSEPFRWKNLDFEQGTTGWSISDNTLGIFDTTTNPNEVIEGTASGIYVGRPGGLARMQILTDPLPVPPGAKWNLSFKARTIATSLGQTSISLRVRIFRPDGSDVLSIIGPFNTSDFTGTMPTRTISMGGTIPEFEGDAMMQFGLIVQNPVGMTRVVFDDFKMEITPK